MKFQLITSVDAGRVRTAENLDRQICRRVERGLHRTGYPQLREVGVACHEGLVTLRGRVPTYYLKQVAQSAALAVPNVGRVENDITVA